MKVSFFFLFFMIKLNLGGKGMIDIDYINLKQIERNEKPYTLKQLEYKKPLNDGEYLIDKDGNRIGTKGDFNTKMLIYELLENGCWDENPRPKYESDESPAYTLSENNIVSWTYDISKLFTKK